MPVKLDSSSGIVACSDGYTDAATLGPFQSLATVQFTISNQAVLAQVAKKNKNDNALHWDPMEFTIPPGQGGFEGKVYGIRFRNAVAGQVADITATGYFEDDPIPFTSPQPFTGSLTPGGFTPSGINFNEPTQSGGYLALTTTGTDPTNPGVGTRFTTDDAKFTIDAVSTTLQSDVSINVDGAIPSNLDLKDNTESGVTTLESSNAASGDALVQLKNLDASGDSTVLIQANNTNGGGTGIKIESTGPTPLGGEPSIHLLSDSAQIVLETNAGGLKLEQFGGASVIEMTPTTPNIHIQSAVELLLSGSSDVLIEGNAGANGKIIVGSGGGGNGGVLIDVPANGVNPTFDVEVNAGTAGIQAGDGFVHIFAGDTTIKGFNGGVLSAAGLDVSSNPAGHPIVLVCDDASGFLSFFGHAGQAQIPGSSITTLAQLITALQNYGLLG